MQDFKIAPSSADMPEKVKLASEEANIEKQLSGNISTLDSIEI